MHNHHPHPKFSIITVTYNAAKVLEDTIQSIVTQTYKNLEYIIVDGGSTDETLDIIHKYQEHITTVISEPDQGFIRCHEQRNKTGNRRLSLFLECR